VLRDLSQQQARTGDHDSAIQTARRLLKLDDLEEETYRSLMRFHAQSGQKAAALHVYEECCEVLLRELGDAPDDATVDLMEEIKNTDQAPLPAPPTVEPTPYLRGFVGRGTELALLEQAYRNTTLGERQIAILGGEPGVGKTRICHVFLDTASRAGARVCWGKCYDGVDTPAYWPWIQVFRALRSEELENQDGGADLHQVLDLQGSETRFQLLETALSRIQSACRSQPVVLVFDNLHSVDSPSLELLEFIARETESARLMVLGTFRDTELRQASELATALGALSALSGYQHLKLEGLGVREVGQLLTTALGTGGGLSLVDLVYQRTEGNPLYVEEVIRRLRTAGEESWASVVNEVPERLRLTIRGRVNRLSPACLSTLTRAAAAGREFDLSILTVAEDGLRMSDVTAHLETAVQAGILEQVSAGEGKLRFTHAIIRDVIYQMIPEPERAAVHQSIGDGLARALEAGADIHPEVVAGHYAGATTPEGRRRYARYAEMAGMRALENSAYGKAISFLQDALHAEDASSRDLRIAQILSHLTRAQLEARRAHNYAAVQPEIQANIRRAAEIYMDHGDGDGLMTLVADTEEAWRDAEMKGFLERIHGFLSTPEGAATLASHGLWQGDYNRDLRRSFSRSVRSAARRKETNGQIRSLEDWALCEYYAGRLDKAWSLAQRAHTRSLTRWQIRHRVQSWGPGPVLGSRGAGGLATLNLLGHLGVQFPAQVGQLDQAFTELELFLSEMVRYRWPLGIYYALTVGGLLHGAAGDFTAARGYLLRGLRDYPAQPVLRLQLASVEYQQGENARGDALVAESLRRSGGPGGAQLYPYAVAIMGGIYRITKKREHAETAREIARRGLGERAGNPLWEDVTRTGLALIAAVDRDPEASARFLRELRGCPPQMRSMVVTRDALVGLLARAADRTALAMYSFRKALQFCEAGFLPEMAWTCLDYAETLLERGGPYNRARAKALLAESRQVARACGMGLLENRLAEILEKHW
jgi:tetratricopeptide (TPR) repeat protein